MKFDFNYYLEHVVFKYDYSHTYIHTHLLTQFGKWTRKKQARKDSQIEYFMSWQRGMGMKIGTLVFYQNKKVCAGVSMWVFIPNR